MSKLSFALFSIATGATAGAGFGSISPSKRKFDIEQKQKQAVISFGYVDVIHSAAQKPSSRLEDLIRIANNQDKTEFQRYEAVRLIALYWPQWTVRRRRNAARYMEPECLLSLATFGHQVEGSSIFLSTIPSAITNFENVETSFINGLKKLSGTAEVRLDPCSLIFIKKTLKEVEEINEQVKRDAKKDFKPAVDFWPFGAHVSFDEAGRLQGEHRRNSPINLVQRKLELFLLPILRSLECAARTDDHQLAEIICSSLDIYKLLNQTVCLESQVGGMSDNARRLISSILANLASFKNETFASKQRRSVVENGFLPLLRLWAIESSDISKVVAYEAIRALKNLDQFFTPKLKNGVGLYFPIWKNVYAPYSKKTKKKLDVVFVHGVLGGAIYTWRRLNESSLNVGVCWPADWLPMDLKSDLIKSESRIFGVQYHSVLPGLSHCVEPVAFRARHLMQDLEMSGLGDNNIIWVTHSFGGIFVKSMLMQNDKFQKNTKAVVFLSTPHLGSPIADQPAKYANILGLVSSELEEIRTDSPHLLQIRRAFVDLAAKYNYDVFAVSENQPTYLLGLRLSAMVVPENSALDVGCGRFVRADVDHLSTCKPASRCDPIYTSILDIINSNFDN